MSASRSAANAQVRAEQHTSEPGEGISLVRRSVQREMYAMVLRARLLRQRVTLPHEENDVAEIGAGLALRPNDVMIAPPSALGAHISRGASLAEIADSIAHPGCSGETGSVHALPVSGLIGDAVTRLIGRQSSVAFLPCFKFENGQEWRSVLRFVGQHRLPILFLFRNHQSPGGSRAFDLRSSYAEFGVPSITVDAADVIAVYRVATEACHHARVGRGATIIDATRVEAVPPLNSWDPLGVLEAYMGRHGAWSEAWADDVMRSEQRAIAAVGNK